MLSEQGVPVSVAALRTYLRRVREEAASEAPRTPTKRLRDARADPRQPERPPPVAPSPSPERRDAAGKETATTRRRRRLGRPSATRDGARDAGEPDPRRSPVEVKPDTDDI